MAAFSFAFMDNILSLHHELVEKTYKHGGYHTFKINDPKPREIHKASVRDRLVHHAVFRILSPYFERQFIFDSYSSRLGKGTHKAINRLRSFIGKVSKNHTKTAWILKCDIKKFFASIDHGILKTILAEYICDKNILWLLAQIIDSFHTKEKPGTGLPLGNLTSQLFVNVYMNIFDQFAKRKLRARHYIRFADDFVIVHRNKKHLENFITKISEFLGNRLKLSPHPNKVSIRTITSGVDFLGWVHFPKYRVLRTSTKRRIFKRLKKNRNNASVQSYLGLMRHGNTYKLRKKTQITNS
ncbi:MAG: RNA-directed DNA polymerase [Parcubacteria group bacterium Licking1014_17]|nr:MAG: RNA-directed DNA polymerase [Parcubacteria group bacterium Licking1014_17]